MISKKSIHPVVAVALLLVVAVVSIIGFQTWFNSYSSTVFTGVETKSSNSVSKTGVDDVIGQKLYLMNTGKDPLEVSSVKLGGVDCDISGNYSTGVMELDLYDCIGDVSSSTPEIVVYTKKEIYSKYIYLPTPIVPVIPHTLFVSVWNTSKISAGSSNSNQIKLPLESSGTYNFNVNWGDDSSNTITSWNQAEVTHTYSSEGEYKLKINGTIVGFRFNSGGDKLKILEISNWGPLRVGNNTRYFLGASNLRFTGTDTLNLTGTTDLTFMFGSASSFNGDISNWNTSKVTNMKYLFSGASSFDGDISNWNTNQVTDMKSMFSGAILFNQSLNNWDTSKVTDMHGMFSSASSFNGDISNWNTSKVTEMGLLFYNAGSFNRNLSSWDVDQVTVCTLFNDSASSWTLPKPNFTSCTP